MRKRTAVFFLCAISASSAQAGAHESWLVTTDLWGNSSYQTLELDRNGNRLDGTFDGDKLEGKTAGDTLHFVVTDSSHATYIFNGKRSGDKIIGTADYPDSNNTKARVNHAFFARMIPPRPAGPARQIEFKPTDYSNEFSPHRKPVLTLWPGDTVHTSTIDSGGVDEHGITRALFGNPQTGPSFIAGAEPGDTLVITLKRLRLNRDYADSLDSIVGHALSNGLAAKAGDLGKPVRWKLDREHGLASIENPTDHLRNFAVPIRPMLGGLAVAPGFGSAAISTGDTGRFGGNMDWNDVIEGNTIYLPVFQPGALLYLGDAHALQGDGETSQYALETSMDVEFSIDVLHGKVINTPRVESPTQIMVLGQAGSLDDALRAATTGMIQWLQQDYDLSLAECAEVLGSSVHYAVANLAGRSVGMVAKIDKARLASLTRVTPRTTQQR